MNKGQDFLDYFYDKREDFWHHNKDIVLIKLISGKKILDIGCGDASLSIKLAEIGKDVTAVDNSADYMNIAREKIKGLNIRVIEEDILKFETEERFDCVVLSGIIEHIEDDKAIIKKAHELLKENGAIILLTSAYPWLYSEYDRNIGHYRRYSYKQIVSLISTNGFEIDIVRYWDLLGLPIVILCRIFNKVIISPQSLKNNLLNKLLNFWFRYFENSVNYHVGLDIIVRAIKK